MRQIALVTGAARNIGKGIATSLLEAGYDCILVDKDPAQLKATLEQLEKIGKCYDYVLDICDIGAIEQLRKWLDERSIQIDVLINNIGFNSHESFFELTSKAMRVSNQTNLEGPFYLTTLLTQRMIYNNNSGSVVFISSVHSKVVRTHPMYSAAKAAIEMFIKEASLELAPYNIRINAISPGPVKDTLELETNKYVPLKYTLQPKDIGEGVVFLISTNARFITGQSLVIDGGFSVNHTHRWIQEHKL